MIVVKVELHSAVTGRVTEIGRTYIHNVGGTPKRGNYSARVCRRGQFDARKTLHDGVFTREGSVQDYPRLSYNVWRLVLRALKSCFPEEK